MGLAVSETLLAKGCSVTGPRRGRVEAFEQAGGTIVEDSASVARVAEILMLLLPSDAALATVLREIGPELGPQHVVVCLSTHPAATKQAAARDVRLHGAEFIDGEISGTPTMVRSGRCSVLLAGEPTVAETLRPLLSRFAAAVTYLGVLGNAVRVKLLTNFLVGVQTYAAAEALALGRRLGLPEGLVVDAIAPSAGGSLMFGLRGRMMAERRFPDGDMPSFLHYFDLLHEALETAAGGEAPLLDLTERMFRRAVAEGHGERDIAAVCDIVTPLPPNPGSLQSHFPR